MRYFFRYNDGEINMNVGSDAGCMLEDTISCPHDSQFSHRMIMQSVKWRAHLSQRGSVDKNAVVDAGEWLFD